jgi:hypothetical protein
MREQAALTRLAYYATDESWEKALGADDDDGE